MGKVSSEGLSGKSRTEPLGSVSVSEVFYGYPIRGDGWWPWEGRDEALGALCVVHISVTPARARPTSFFCQAIQAVSEALLGGILAVKVQTPSADSQGLLLGEYPMYMAFNMGDWSYME